jgi:hypothetical protein
MRKKRQAAMPTRDNRLARIESSGGERAVINLKIEARLTPALLALSTSQVMALIRAIPVTPCSADAPTMALTQGETLR